MERACPSYSAFSTFISSSRSRFIRLSSLTDMSITDVRSMGNRAIPSPREIIKICQISSYNPRGLEVVELGKLARFLASWAVWNFYQTHHTGSVTHIKNLIWNRMNTQHPIKWATDSTQATITQELLLIFSFRKSALKIQNIAKMLIPTSQE